MPTSNPKDEEQDYGILREETKDSPKATVHVRGILVPGTVLGLEFADRWSLELSREEGRLEDSVGARIEEIPSGAVVLVTTTDDGRMNLQLFTPDSAPTELERLQKTAKVL